MKSGALYKKALTVRTRPGTVLPKWWENASQAHFFDISDSIVRYAVKLTEDQDIKRILPFVHLPYPKVFIEFSHVALVTACGMQFKSTDPEGDTLGMLLEKQDEEILCTPVLPGGYPYYYSYVLRLSDGQERDAEPNESYIYEKFAETLVGDDVTNMKGLELMSRRHRAFYPYILSLINCPNLSEIKEIDLAVSGKRNRKPIVPSTIQRRVTVKLSRVQQRRAGEDGVHAHMRLHTVRGHFKVRKTGIYWWSDFWRGDSNSGLVEKIYDVRK